MNIYKSFSATLLCAAISGCACFPTKEPTLVPVSSVLDALKDELNAYRNTKSTVVVEAGTCSVGGSAIDVNPKEVTVTLETVSSHKSEPTAGITAPIGIISFDPSFSGSYSTKRTQTLVVPLAVDEASTPQAVPAGEHPIAEAIAKFRDELLRVNHKKTPCFKASKYITLTLAFDVVNQSTGGFSFKLVPFKLGDKETFGDESHQKLQLSFELAGSLLQVR